MYATKQVTGIWFVYWSFGFRGWLSVNICILCSMNELVATLGRLLSTNAASSSQETDGAACRRRL